MQKGFGTVVIVAIIAVVLALGSVVYFTSAPTPAMMEKSSDESAMIQKDATQAGKIGEGHMMDDGAMMKGDDTQMMKDEKMDDGAMMEKSDALMMTAGSYEAYAPEKLAKAESGKVVLFFRASWCPACRGVDADIKMHLNDVPKDVTILDVNYDDSTALKQKYGVTYQHTFVQVDKDGNQIAKWSGSPTLADIVSKTQ